jgi:hypothetical protein
MIKWTDAAHRIARRRLDFDHIGTHIRHELVQYCSFSSLRSSTRKPCNAPGAVIICLLHSADRLRS